MAVVIIEAEARRLLRDCEGLGGVEAWIAWQRWQAVPGGWRVIPDLQGWRFRLEVMPEGLRVTEGEPGAGGPAWVVGPL